MDRALRRLTAGSDSKGRLISIFVGAVALPSVALSLFSFNAAESSKTERKKRDEKRLEYIEEDLTRVARARALEAAKRVGLERLLEGAPEEIETALAQAGLDPGMFEYLRFEGYSSINPGAAKAPAEDANSPKAALDMDAPPATGEGEELLPVLGADSRSSGVLRFRFACPYVHGTLVREYFEKEFGNPELVVRVTEPDGSLVYESAKSPPGREFEARRVMSSPSFGGLKLFLRYKEGSIHDEARRLELVKIAVIALIDVMLGVGLYLVYSNVRRELQLSKLKSDFVANVSHELKTPLALIRLFSETLELGRVPNDEKRRQYYRVINKESQRLTQLINNILDFSRIEAGRREYKFVKSDLARVVDEVLDAYRFSIEQQGFAVDVAVAEGLPEVEIDPEALGQAFINLLNNALKYSREDKQITIALRVQDGKLMLSVGDKGIGIATGEHAKIFDKFYRAEDSLVHETKGSGLGLSLVRHIMEAHGGSVEVESAPGRGSTFTLSLPLPKQHAPAAAAAPFEGGL